MDKVVRLANDAPAEAGLANHVRANTQRLARELAGSGASPEGRRLAHPRSVLAGLSAEDPQRR